ncbi:MAG: PEP-CTERM sorting domain-containing protein [Verrucomicrobia bacterium]|nr:PEP-CTERM sorting domain-containing protein [Verrucomicrobiota bacterium]
MGYGPGVDNSDAQFDPFQSGQNSLADDDLRHVFQTIAWDGAGLHPLAYTFTGLTANTTYQLDVLYFSGFWNARQVALVINGTLVSFYDISNTEARDTAFAVTSDGSGEIAMLIAASAGYGGTGFQDGSLVSAFALSTVTPVPEPATWAVLAGAGALAFAAWRRSRRGRA